MNEHTSGYWKQPFSGEVEDQQRQLDGKALAVTWHSSHTKHASAVIPCPCLPSASPLLGQSFLVCGCDLVLSWSSQQLRGFHHLKQQHGKNFEGTGASMCAMVVSGSWMATRLMCPCHLCLDKDITLGISTKNTASSHRLALPTLCEGCEPLRKHAHTTMPKLISPAGVMVPGKNDHMMSAMGWAHALVIYSTSRLSWGLPAMHCAYGCHLLWFGAAWMNHTRGWKCRRERTTAMCKALLRYPVRFTDLCCLVPVSTSTKRRV